jgi:Spy/CpxP family protein refolding chaperone
MLHSNLILVSTAALVLGAGVVVGRLSDRVEGMRPPQQQQDRRGNWLADQLKLTADQHQKMDEIWNETSQQIEKTFQGRRDDEKAWEQAVLGLLTPQQQADYEELNQEFRDRRDERFKDRDRLVQVANDRSRALLDDDQQKKWDVLSKEMQARHRGTGMGPGRGPGMGGPGMGPGRGPDFPGFRSHDERPTTKPTEGAEG